MTAFTRRGACCISLPWRKAFPPEADRTFTANDRAIMAGMYPLFSPVITSTAKLQKPVDCVMAGDQKSFGKGSARGRLLRHIFRE